eukprot:1087374-Prymnesium_polylepis.1
MLVRSSTLRRAPPAARATGRTSAAFRACDAGEAELLVIKRPFLFTTVRGLWPMMRHTTGHAGWH